MAALSPCTSRSTLPKCGQTNEHSSLSLEPLLEVGEILGLGTRFTPGEKYNTMGNTPTAVSPVFVLSRVRFKSVLDIERLELPSCQVSAIVGPSGGGKTTLLRLLNRMTTPDSGSILFAGEPLQSLDPVALRRRVVMLAQMPVIFPGTVEENLLIGFRLAEKEQRGREAVGSMMARVGLDTDLASDAGQLSGGEKQRLALARVMLMDPEVLLLDEPSASLDEQTEKRIFELVTDFCRERCKTLVLVTHSEKEFIGYYDTLVRIKQGRVEEVTERGKG